MKTKNKGFTLIELIIVIVVLGILAITALPRLLNLQTDSRIAALNGLKAGMQSAADMVYPLAIQNGVADQSSGQITIDAGPVRLAYGYPAAFAKQTWSVLMEAKFADGVYNPETEADWYFHNPRGGANDSWIRFMTKSLKDPKYNCYLIYNQATESKPPYFELVTTGC